MHNSGWDILISWESLLTTTNCLFADDSLDDSDDEWKPWKHIPMDPTHLSPVLICCWTHVCIRFPAHKQHPPSSLRMNFRGRRIRSVLNALSHRMVGPIDMDWTMMMENCRTSKAMWGSRLKDTFGQDVDYRMYSAICRRLQVTFSLRERQPINNLHRYE